MFVITADQIDSRTTPDRVGPARTDLNDRFRDRLALAADRNAGDELQILTADAGTALEIVLELTRTDAWSVGLGVGAVRRPLPDDIREATGDAFFAARLGVDRAKRKLTRFAIGVLAGSRSAVATSDAEALIDLLLALRQRRSAAGWELYDLLRSGLPQSDAATELAISQPAVSSRARAANLRIEADAEPALCRLLESLDREASTSEEDR
ncbi:helix-turn-helix domain-containing protein [Agromyces atrinae]|uniref:helix-turn-helix domain-containing protein n=1 Tax=Agromyces atrinae TaxID=592376 RepID=UPI001F57DD3A|nr:helix-turn-helix domain-containing protein [Agromyces atrinae]MCI2958363.1 helix-turn-helix domain-containing protein [Agromyces atrinae]